MYGRDGRFSEGFNRLCSAWIVYVRRATDKKLAHWCLNGYLRHQVARTNFKYVRICSRMLSLCKGSQWWALCEACMQTACNCVVMILGHARKKHVDVLKTLCFAMEKWVWCPKWGPRWVAWLVSFSTRPQRLFETLTRCTEAVCFWAKEGQYIQNAFKF